MSTTILKTVFFNAKPETVWSFLTDKDKLGIWYHPAQEDLSDGSDYSLYSTGDDGARNQIVSGRVLEMQAPNKLVTTFVIGPFGGNETTLTWQLVDAAGGTQLTLSHEGIAEALGQDAPDAGVMGLLMALDHGWDKHFDKLRNGIAA